MSNGRKLRRSVQGRKPSPLKGRAMTSTPTTGTTRRWLKAAEAEGTVRRAEDKQTGAPGRPAHQWELTEEGRAKRTLPLDMMMEQVRRRENAAKRRNGGRRGASDTA